MSFFIAPKGDGFTVGKKFEKLGYKGIDSAELIFDNYRIPKENLIGEVEGEGFFQADRRARARPYQRRRARCRNGGWSASACHRVCAASQDDGKAHRRTPGDPA
jgi:hypothetical protein